MQVGLERLRSSLPGLCALGSLEVPSFLGEIGATVLKEHLLILEGLGLCIQIPVVDLSLVSPAGKLPFPPSAWSLASKGSSYTSCLTRLWL